MDVAALRQAYAAVLALAKGSGFRPPPAGEWTADQVLAHLITTDTGVAATALAVASGQRPTYDNRYSLDPWNLAQVVGEAGSTAGLIDRVSAAGDRLCEIAEGLPDSAAQVEIRCLLISGDRRVFDGSMTVGMLITGLATTHLPGHRSQLASLSR